MTGLKTTRNALVARVLASIVNMEKEKFAAAH